MRRRDIIYREATGTDMPGISRVRLAVVENAMTREQLDARGITEEDSRSIVPRRLEGMGRRVWR